MPSRRPERDLVELDECLPIYGLGPSTAFRRRHVNEHAATSPDRLSTRLARGGVQCLKQPVFRVDASCRCEKDRGTVGTERRCPRALRARRARPAGPASVARSTASTRRQSPEVANRTLPSARKANGSERAGECREPRARSACPRGRLVRVLARRVLATGTRREGFPVGAESDDRRTGLANIQIDDLEGLMDLPEPGSPGSSGPPPESLRVTRGAVLEGLEHPEQAPIGPALLGQGDPLLERQARGELRANGRARGWPRRLASMASFRSSLRICRLASDSLRASPWKYDAATSEPTVDRDQHAP